MTTTTTDLIKELENYLKTLLDEWVANRKPHHFLNFAGIFPRYILIVSDTFRSEQTFFLVNVDMFDAYRLDKEKFREMAFTDWDFCYSVGINALIHKGLN